MQAKFYSRLLTRFLYFLAIVDTINGFFIHKGALAPFGIIYKTIILLLAIKIVSTTSKLKGHFFFFLTYIPFFGVYISLNTDSQLGETFTHLFKFVNVVFVYYAAVHICKLGLVERKDVQTVFYVNSVVLLLNIYAGLLGVGYYAYEGNLGFKGFIYAHNEMSGMMAVLFGVSYFFMYCSRRLNGRILFLVNLIFLVAALLVSTKAGILLVTISLILVPYANMKYGIFHTFFRISKLKIALFFMILCLIVYYGYVLLDYSGAIERWTYFFDKDGVDAIYSSRDVFWEEKKVEWETGNIGVKLLGMGGNRSVEMDQADTLLNYGILGVIVVYPFYFSLIVKAFRYRKKSNYAKFVLGLDFFILAASCIAGHLLFSGLMGIPFALMNAMLYHPMMKSKQLAIV